jgi:hypothetical protein
MPEKRPCPRQAESPFMMPAFEYLNKPDDGTCDYCGSLEGDLFMRRIEVGNVVLEPTDKNYKVYVKNDGGEPFTMTYRIDKMEDRRRAAALNAKLLREVVGTNLPAHLVADAQAHERGDELDASDQRHWKWETKVQMQAKFYFQHLSPEQRVRFIELLNAKKLKLDFPGHFYRLPFFIAREERGDHS